MKAVLLSIGMILILSNFMTLIFENEFDQNVKNATKYANYFVINVFAILILSFCMFLMFKRRKANKCILSIIVCDLLIFFVSMYTFRTMQTRMDYKIESFLRILIDFLMISLSAIFIHRA